MCASEPTWLALPRENARTNPPWSRRMAAAGGHLFRHRRILMTHRWTALAALILVFAGPTSIARAQDHDRGDSRDRDHGETVDCESRDMGRTRCRVSWNDARMVRQLSDTRCVRDRNWGVDRRGIWVDHGCAGRFVAAGRDSADRRHDGGDRDHGGWQPQPGWDSRFNVACESKDYQYHFCAVDLGGAGRVTLRRQISNSACVEGRNWGSNRAGVWVNGGCAAEFTVDRRWR
jgi:hypothetical protein